MKVYVYSLNENCLEIKEVVEIKSFNYNIFLFEFKFGHLCLNYLNHFFPFSVQSNFSTLKKLNEKQVKKIESELFKQIKNEVEKIFP